ncbi:MAG TPA: hypothetical protein VGD37_38995 [Kofleriaceae bacterium]
MLCSLVACGDDQSTVKILVFQASPDAIEAGQTTTLVFAVDPPDAKISITGVGDVTGKTQVSVTPTANTSYQLTANSGKATSNKAVMVTVGPTSAASIKVDPATATPTAGNQLDVTLTVLASNGKPAPGFRGTVHIASTDNKAVLPADVAFSATDAGVKHVSVTLETAGLSTLTATDLSAKAGVQGSTSVTVQPAAAASYALTTLPATATAGEALVLTITVKDVFGNVATNYAGQAQLTSTDGSDVLPPSGAFTSGVRTVNLAFTKVGNHTAKVVDVATTIAPANTSAVAIGPASPFRVSISQASQATTAGTDQAFTATLVDFFNNTCTNYQGTLHFAAIGDPNAAVPADFTFGAGDAGTHDFTATLKTSGSVTVAVSDTVASGVTGAASWNVGAAAAATCVASQAPATATAGSVVGLTVAVRDTFGNLATDYAGTVRLTATDGRANLPGDVTFVPATDAGSHAFSVALLTTGSQTLTATDLANPTIQCTTGVAITPAAPKLVLSVPGNANAGYAVAVGVTVKDLFDNAIPNYTGTVTFASTDAGTGAVKPAAITFTGSEGGVATTSATFITPGTQTLSASDAGSPQASGSTAAAVHGLIYTAPNTGRVRLVANAAQSNAQIVQFDLVANEKLEVSTFFGGGPGSFAAGMNLPLDTNRVMADTTLFTPGPALPAGGGTRAAKGVIGPDHVLYTVVSRKRVATTIFSQETEVQAGQVFYSVRLKLTPTGTVGPVFDGAQPTALFRAAVRDQWGDDFVSQSEFGVGKLEIR